MTIPDRVDDVEAGEQWLDAGRAQFARSGYAGTSIQDVLGDAQLPVSVLYHHFGGKLGQLSVYGQEANPTTWRLAAMNLAIRGMDYNLGREPADSFTRNQQAVVNVLNQTGGSASGPRSHLYADSPP